MVRQQGSRLDVLQILLENEQVLHYLDEKQKGQAYLVATGDYGVIPRFADQGIRPLDEAFTSKALAEKIKGVRKQVRVFIMDQAVISSIGNAYADEILFAAGLHPKMTCNQLGDEQINKLHSSIVDVLRAGIAQVEDAAQPVEVKVRSHMKVRNRRGEPCPTCGTTIRAVGVLGHDAFVCPSCQPATRKQFIDWNKK